MSDEAIAVARDDVAAAVERYVQAVDGEKVSLAGWALAIHVAPFESVMIPSKGDHDLMIEYSDNPFSAAGMFVAAGRVITDG